MDEFKPLTGVRHADAAIVGGGWTGLLTAGILASRGLKVALVTESLPSASGPVLATLHRPDSYLRIADWHGTAVLHGHVRQLHRLLAALPAWLSSAAAFREAEIYAYARTPEEVPFLLAQQEFMAGLGLPVMAAPDAGGCPFPVERSTCMPGLLIQPAPLAGHLCKAIRKGRGMICNSSRVINATANQVFTAEGRIDAPLVLLCTGKPLGLNGRRLSALLVTHTCLSCRLTPPVPLHTVQTALQNGGLMLLPAQGAAYALWDAGRTGTRREEQRTAIFRRILQHRLPEWEAGPMAFRQVVRPLDGLPIAGSVKAPGGRILFAAGAEDLLSAMLAAQVLARLALRTPHRGDLLLRPDRPLPVQALRQSLRRQRRHRTVNALRRHAPRCSHCACRLRYHPAAGWWGCPACGSAFGTLGQRIGGPTLSDASIHAFQRPGW